MRIEPGKYPTFCPECGFGVAVDEDGLCVGCGCTAIGTGVDALFATPSPAGTLEVPVGEVVYEPVTGERHGALYGVMGEEEDAIPHGTNLYTHPQATKPVGEVTVTDENPIPTAIWYGAGPEDGALLYTAPAVGSRGKLEGLEAEPVQETLYTMRCGWCGAYEGTVDPTEACAHDHEGYTGPHQFGIEELYPDPLYTRPHLSAPKVEPKGKLEPWMVSWMKYRGVCTEEEIPDHERLPVEFLDTPSEELDQIIAAAIAAAMEAVEPDREWSKALRVVDYCRREIAESSGRKDELEKILTMLSGGPEVHQSTLSAPKVEKWLPTADNINALPEGIKEYVYRLETRADPAGEIRELIIAKDIIQALEDELISLSAPKVERDREAMEALESIRLYGSDTLSGRVDGPADAEWLKDGIREIVRRADAILSERTEGGIG